MLETNENSVRLIGTANISESLKLGHQYNVTAVADCVKVEASDNQDSTMDKVHKLKLITAEVLDSGRVITTKVKGSQSKLFRFRVIEEMASQRPEIDPEGAYNVVMAYLLDNVEPIVRGALKGSK